MTETREQRKVWMDKLQEQNPSLLEQEHQKKNGHGHATLEVQTVTNSNTPHQMYMHVAGIHDISVITN